MFKIERVTAATQSTLISLSRVKEENPIVVNVQGQSDAEKLCYLMGQDTPLRYLMLDYCEQTGAVFEYVRFLSTDGVRVSPDKTPDDLKMEDGYVIDAFSEQIGG